MNEHLFKETAVKKYKLLCCSFARALQTSATQVWQGRQENEKAAQQEMLKLAKHNGLASLGKYAGDMKTTAAGKSTFVANNAY